MIRAYTAKDALPTFELYNRSVREVARREPGLELGEWGARLAALAPVVCVVDDTLAGFSDVRADGYISLLIVDPAFTRRGVASALLRSHLATVSGDLFTDASVTERGFFERRGFVVVGHEESRYRMVLQRGGSAAREGSA